MSNEEIWRPVPGFPNVEASSTGRVRTTLQTITIPASGNRPEYKMRIRGRILSQWEDKGRCTTHAGRTTINVGRLVCLAFHGEPPPGLPNALHRDDNSWNNTPTNLYWGNQKQNIADAKLSERFRGQGNPSVKLTESQALEIKRRLLAGEKGFLLAREFGISETTLHNLKTGRTWGWLEIPSTLPDT